MMQTQLLAGECVAITGNLASMTQAEAADLVTRHSGRFSHSVTADVTLLVVGRQGWPLARSGKLSRKLRQAHRLQYAGAKLAIYDEHQFLQRLGGADHNDCFRSLYDLAELSDLLHVPGRQLRHWVKIGLLVPAEMSNGLPRFDFVQVAGAKTLSRLICEGATPARLRRSLRQWSRMAPDRRTTDAAWALFERWGRLLSRNARDQLIDPAGQLHFDFQDETMQPLMPLPPHEETPIDGFTRGYALEQAGQFDLAAEAYGQALKHGGPVSEVCFNLGNVLLELGRPEDAIERYRQAIELDSEHAAAWNNLGVALAALGRVSEAVAAFHGALDAAPEYADAHYNLADTLAESGRGLEAARHWHTYLKCGGDGERADYARRQLGQA